jgi:hypothetical protein
MKSSLNPAMKIVKATREGLIGRRTASGYVIDRYVSFVALPSRQALWRFIHIINPLNGRHTYAQVLDVGPWNSADNEYVFGSARPQAESGIDLFGRKTNGAGIDLGERVWSALGLIDNSEVAWEFLPMDDEAI